MTTWRPYEGEDDFWRMRSFLREVYLLNGRRELSWHVSRLDYARWHSCLNVARVRLEDVVLLWEEDGEITAFLMPDGGYGEAHLCMHPALRTRELEEEMIVVAEERLPAAGADGARRLTVWSPEGDDLREEILARRGYRRQGGVEHEWRRELGAPVPATRVAPGFTVRALGDGLELLERCYASGLGFHENDIQIALENRTDPTWYRNIQNAPLYRRDLDLVAVAADGAIAAFTTLWFDDVTRSAVFEPVATVPAYRRKGLAAALMNEGLRRVQGMGATVAHVGGFSRAANALYQAVMGPDRDLYAPWTKEWKG